MAMNFHGLKAAAALAAGLGLAACGDGGAGASSGGQSEYEREGDFVKGEADAPVVMVEYASAACPACGQFSVNVKPTLDEYIADGTLRLAFREMITAPRDLAIAGFMLARCAPEDEYIDTLSLFFEQQRSIYEAMERGEAMQQFELVADSAGIGEGRFRECMSDEAAMQSVVDASERAAEDGITATPTFIINGETISGDQGPDGAGMVWHADDEPIEDGEGTIPAQFTGDSFARIIEYYEARATSGE